MLELATIGRLYAHVVFYGVVGVAMFVLASLIFIQYASGRIAEERNSPAEGKSRGARQPEGSLPPNQSCPG